MKRTLIPAATLALFATSAFAAAPTFAVVDANGDNAVTWEELSAALPSASLFDFNAVDQNGDGGISETEMTNNFDALDLDADDVILAPAAVDLVVVPKAEETRFTLMDTDGDMMLSYDELSAAAPRVSQFDFTEADQNGDGMLTEMELTNGMDVLETDASTGEITSDGGDVVTQPEIENQKDS